MYIGWNDLNEEEKELAVNGYCDVVKKMFDRECSKEEALNFLTNSKFRRNGDGTIDMIDDR